MSKPFQQLWTKETVTRIRADLLCRLSKDPEFYFLCLVSSDFAAIWNWHRAEIVELAREFTRAYYRKQHKRWQDIVKGPNIGACLFIFPGSVSSKKKSNIRLAFLNYAIEQLSK